MVHRLFKLILCLVGIITATFLVWRGWIHYKVNSDLAAIHKAGYPATLRELEQKYYAPVPDKENAVTYFYDALAQLDTTNGIDGKRWRSNFMAGLELPLTPGRKAEISAILGRYRPVLLKLRSVPDGLKARYPLD